MRILRRATATVLLVCLLPACTSYRTTDLAPIEAVQGERTIVVRMVEGIDTTNTRVSEPWVQNDSLGGTIQACEPQANRMLPWTCASVPWAVPLEAVDAIRVRRSDWAKTGVLVGGIFFGSLLGVYGGDLY